MINCKNSTAALALSLAVAAATPALAAQRIHHSGLNARAWDRLAGSDPFLSRAFLSSLEVSGSVGPWIVRRLVIVSRSPGTGRWSGASNTARFHPSVWMLTFRAPRAR